MAPSALYRSRNRQLRFGKARCVVCAGGEEMNDSEVEPNRRAGRLRTITNAIPEYLYSQELLAARISAPASAPTERASHVTQLTDA